MKITEQWIRHLWVCFGAFGALRIDVPSAHHELSHVDHMVMRIRCSNVDVGAHMYQCNCMAPDQLVGVAEEQVVDEESTQMLHLVMDGHFALQMLPHDRSELPMYVHRDCCIRDPDT